MHPIQREISQSSLSGLGTPLFPGGCERNTIRSVVTRRCQQGAIVCSSAMRSKVCPRDHILYGRNFSSPSQTHEQIMAFLWLRRGLWALIATLLCVSAEKGSESRSGLILELQAALNNLVEDGKGYLGNLAGKQTVLSVSKVGSSREFDRIKHAL